MVDALEAVLDSHQLPFIRGGQHSGRAAVGLGSPTDPVLRAVLCALRILDACRTWHDVCPVQIGIHYGSVRAGTEPGGATPFHLSGPALVTADATREIARPNTVTATAVAWRCVGAHLRGLIRGRITAPDTGVTEVIECTGAVEDHHH